jgi:hypothetical protein
MERELNKLGRQVPQLGVVDVSARRARVKRKSKEEVGTSAGEVQWRLGTE